MSNKYYWSVLTVLMFVVSGCGEPLMDNGAAGSSGTTSVTLDDAAELIGDEPENSSVRHILIAFRGSLPEQVVPRSKEEAAKLAYEIFERARAGEDFQTLVREYSDDEDRLCNLANLGQPAFESPDMNKKVFKREDMVTSFGDIAFSLDVNEIGIADYEPRHCPYGWHIIKRVK